MQLSPFISRFLDRFVGEAMNSIREKTVQITLKEMETPFIGKVFGVSMQIDVIKFQCFWVIMM